MKNECIFLYGLGEACSRALQTVRDLRRRYTSSEEQRRNFSPYHQSKKKKAAAKRTTWTITVVCLASHQQRRVPTDSKFKENLVEAGLGEKKIIIPDLDCGAAEFKDILLTKFPKLKDGGGFELLRCVANSKSLEVISTTVSRLPRLLKAVIGSGKVYLRPIQRDLDLKPETLSGYEVTHCCCQLICII